MFKAVIFDWDSTLADTEFAVVTSFQSVLREIGCEVSNEFIKRRIGTGAKNTLKEILRLKKLRFDEMLLEELVKKKIEKQIELIKKVQLFEGALELLNCLHKRMRARIGQ